MDSDETKAKKIELILEIYEHDRKHVMLFVSVCLALPAFTLAQLHLQTTPIIAKVLLLVSMSLFVAAALCYFRYAQIQSWKMLWAVDLILSLDPEKLRKELMGKDLGAWATAGWYYNVGSKLLKTASALYLGFLIFYLLIQR